MRCKWDYAWTMLRCNGEATITGMCIEHTAHCINVNCDNLAIRECPVCGHSTCIECYHYPKAHMKGLNSKV